MSENGEANGADIDIDDAFDSKLINIEKNRSGLSNSENSNSVDIDLEDSFDSKLHMRESVRGSDDPTMLEIKKLPRMRRSLSTRLSTKFSSAGKAMHIFKDRKKKRVDETHKHFLTAHCIRDGIRYTTNNMKDEEADKHIISDASFRFIKRTTLPVTTAQRDEDLEPSASMKYFGASSSASSMGSTFSCAPSPDNKSFEYKEYAPHVFLKLRKHWGITQKAYLESLASEELYLDFQSNSKSGQFFFFTNDKFFMIKTLTPQEGIWLQEILEAYYRHNLKYPDTMLVKVMGLYRIKVPRKSKRQVRTTHFVVMRSTFDTVLPMHKKFDLKGSSVGREASASDKKKLFPVLKDRDLENSGIQLKFGPDNEKLLTQLQVDCELLTSLNLMDYSLLIGIFDKSRVDPAHGFDNGALREILRQDNCLHFTDRLEEHGVVYFLGIIDFLQHYNTNKRFETIAKSVVNSSKEISSVKPKFYAERLVQFITKFVA